MSRAPRQKRTRKTKEKQNELKEEDEEEEQDVLADNCILESPDESLIKEGGSPSVQTNNENCTDEEPLKSKNATDTSTDERKEKVQNPKRKNSASQSQTDDNFVNDDDDASAQEDKCRVKKSAVRRNRKANVGQSETCDTEQDQSLHDASMEVNVDEMSVLSCSTVTVSFEEFVQSQMQNPGEVAADAKLDTCAAESSEANPCTDASHPVIVAVSPRTLTVQAEVHPISPDHEMVKGPQLKVASIFTRNKKDSQLKDSKQPSSDNPQVSTDVLPGLKRKSNVVLHEEDLELAVVESSSTPRCTQEERKQFMNAFKQPGLDGSKAKPSKGLSKSKPAKENASETAEPEKKANETDPVPTVSEQGTEQQKAKAVGKKRGRKSVKKDQTDQSEEVPVTPMQEEPPASVEVENKTSSGDVGDKQCVKELRRSTREQTCRQAAPAPERNPSPRRTRSREKAETPAASHQDDVTPTSTPKSHRVRKNVYKAEMLYPPDKRESPIRYAPPGCVRCLYMLDH